jgi:hypothetical protein
MVSLIVGKKSLQVRFILRTGRWRVNECGSLVVNSLKRDVPSAAKAASSKEADYRSAEALRHPKSEVFSTL